MADKTLEMERPFMVHVNLSNILKDQKDAHYIMYIDDTKMTIVYELIEWIRWSFSITHCVYLTHDNSVIHELEDIKILYALKNIRVQNCDHIPCVHTKVNHLFKKLNFFVQWEGTKVPKLFLNKVNDISKKLAQKNGGGGKVIKNGCSEEETASSIEVENVVNDKIKELDSGNINSCENQLSENLNSNVCESSKTNFNISSNIKLDDTAVKMDNFNKAQSVPSDISKSESDNVCNNNTTNFNTNSNIKLNDKTVGMNNANKVHSVLSDKCEYVLVNNVNRTDSMGTDIKLNDTATELSISNKAQSVLSDKQKSIHVNNTNHSNSLDTDIKFYDTTVGLNSSNKVHSVPTDENKFFNAPIKTSKSEIEKITSFVDINLSGNTECNEYEQINQSNQKRFQSVSNDKMVNSNKTINKGPKPFSVGEILTNLRSEFNNSFTDHELNTSTQQNQNCSLSNGQINDVSCFKMEKRENSPNDSDVIVSVIKRKRTRQRRHRPKRLRTVQSTGPRFNKFSPLHEPVGQNIPRTVNLCTPYYTKQSSHIRFPSDDEEFFEASHPESDKQPEQTHHDLSKSNQFFINGMEQSSWINGAQETLPTTEPSTCDENDESKVDDFSEANKEFSTLHKLILLQDQQSHSGSLFEYSNEENQETNGVPKATCDYDFNLSTLRSLKEKFPSPMVVERFY